MACIGGCQEMLRVHASIKLKIAAPGILAFGTIHAVPTSGYCADTYALPDLDVSNTLTDLDYYTRCFMAIVTGFSTVTLVGTHLAPTDSRHNRLNNNLPYPSHRFRHINNAYNAVSIKLNTLHWTNSFRL
jgi:hypothetical protein